MRAAARRRGRRSARAPPSPRRRRAPRRTRSPPSAVHQPHRYSMPPSSRRTGSPSRSKKTSPARLGQARVARPHAPARDAGDGGRRLFRDCDLQRGLVAQERRSARRPAGPVRGLAGAAASARTVVMPSSTSCSRWSRRASATRLRWSSATQPPAALEVERADGAVRDRLGVGAGRAGARRCARGGATTWRCSARVAAQLDRRRSTRRRGPRTRRGGSNPWTSPSRRL